MSTIPIQSDDRPTGDALSLPAVNGGASRAIKVIKTPLSISFSVRDIERQLWESPSFRAGRMSRS